MANHAARTGNFKKKVGASGVVLAAGAALLSGGIYAGWTSEARVDQGVGAVDLSAGFIETGGTDNLFDNIADAFPGDHWTRYATLANSGSIDQTFSVRVDTLHDELTAPDDGLKAAITTCAVAFVDGDCEVNDVTELEPAYTDEENVYHPAVTQPNLDDDAVSVMPDGFITDDGRGGANVVVGEDDDVFFKVVYTLNEEADQANFEGKPDVAVVEVTSLTAQRAGQDRTNG